jgi:hypothetical protein
MKTKFLLVAVSATVIGGAGTAVADPKDPAKLEQVLINRQANCGYGAGNNQFKDAWQGVNRAGFKNLGEVDGQTVIGNGGPGGDGFGEKPIEPPNELDPGNSNCGATGAAPA